MPIIFVSYNVLADSYIRPDRYPYTPAKWLTPGLRHPALIEEIALMDADIVALQEVEQPVFARVEQRLTPLGYVGRYEPKGRNKPDGCALFVRRNAGQVLAWRRLDFADAAGDEPVSGHLAQIAMIDCGGRSLGVANTHLKWAPRDTPRAEHLGARQLDELVAACATASTDGWIVCGDLNCTPDSAVLESLEQASFSDAHAGLDTATCNANREPRKLDHIFIAGKLGATPSPIDVIQADTPLPSPSYPSDHLPVMVRLDWIGETG
jgi:endonuclease/exonuclease/phosphatase family metal-dependent hydrolase